MTEAIDPQPTDKVLEIGTGSGYQAAVLSPLVKDVYTIEIVEQLGKRAARTLKQLGYKNVHTNVGDGYQGWPEVAPFDKIIVTCSPEKVPQPLVDQLKEGGLMVVPVGERYQQTLYLYAQDGRQAEDGSPAADALRADDRRGRVQRKVKPDPANPQISNGSFEERAKATPRQASTPTGWHYQRQLKVETDPAHARRQALRHLPQRRARPRLPRPARLRRRRPQGCQAATVVLGPRPRHPPGPEPEQLPGIVITFYDDHRALIGDAALSVLYVHLELGARRRRRSPCHSKPARQSYGSACSAQSGELSLDNIKLSRLRSLANFSDCAMQRRPATHQRTEPA